MRATILASFCLLAACRSEPSFAGPPGTGGPSRHGARGREAAALSCGNTPCSTLTEELAKQCSYPGTTVTLSDVRGYTVLRARTDPESYVYTSFTLVFDSTGKLVGRDSFVSEYARHETEGVVPRGDARNERDGCAGSKR